MRLNIVSLILFTWLPLIHSNAQNIEFPQTKVDISKIDISKVDISKLNMDLFSFGVRLTPSIGWLHVNHHDMQAGGASLKFSVGGIAEYSVNNLISVVSGVNYNNYGGYVFDNNSLNDITTADNFRLNYSQIEVPLGVKIKTPAMGRISYFLHGGLTSGFVLSATEKIKSINSNQINTPTDIYSLTNPSSAGFVVSVGSELRILRKFRLIGEIAYKRALTNTANAKAYVNDGKYSNQSELQIFPGSMEFSLGFLFK